MDSLFRCRLHAGLRSSISSANWHWRVVEDARPQNYSRDSADQEACFHGHTLVVSQTLHEAFNRVDAVAFGWIRRGRRNSQAVVRPIIAGLAAGTCADVRLSERGILRDLGARGFFQREVGRNAFAHNQAHERQLDFIDRYLLSFPAQWDPKLGIHVT